MAQANKIDSRVQLEFNAGMDNEGNPKVKRKSFYGVKVTSTADDLYNIALALEPLQMYPLINIERDDTFEIVNAPA